MISVPLVINPVYCIITDCLFISLSLSPPPPPLPPGNPFLGAVLSSKAEAHKHLEEARRHARKAIHALHKSQDKLQLFEVSTMC